MELRDEVMGVAGNAAQYLIGYQADFLGIDNRSYFARLVAAKSGYNWHDCGIEHLKGENRYLMGVRQSG